jgi:hypothetical protein
MMLFPRDIALITRHFSRSVVDVGIWWCPEDWSEVIIVCIVICGYDVVSSRSSFVKEQFCEICWSFGDLMIIVRLKWTDDVLFAAVIMLVPPDQALLRNNFIGSVEELVISWSWEDWSEVMTFLCLCDILLFISRDKALISGTFLRSVADVVMCWSLADLSE